MTDSDLRALYDEELAVAKDAISNLRTSFRCDNYVHSRGGLLFLNEFSKQNKSKKSLIFFILQWV